MGSIQKFQQAGEGGGDEDILFWKKLEFLRGPWQISFVPISSQLAAGARRAGGGGGDLSGGPYKSMDHGWNLGTTTIFFILIKTTFKKYFLRHLYQLKALLNWTYLPWWKTMLKI